MKANAKGFTLIELLVVIAIIGLLATVVMTSLNSARKKGRDARRVEDINQIKTALELYYDSNGQYPTTSQGTAALVSGGFMSVVPTDPQGNAYNYRGTSTDYVLYITLEDSNHKALDSDVDGSVNVDGTAISCADPVYCVQP